MKRSNPDYSTTVVEEKPLETLDYGTQSQPVLKLKRGRQALDASKRLAFELSQFSTQQEILQTLVDLEKELPLESLEVVEFVIRSLWERFYETEDAAVGVKVISLLGSVARFPGVNVHAIAEELIKLLNAKDEDKTKGISLGCVKVLLGISDGPEVDCFISFHVYVKSQVSGLAEQEF